MAKTMNKLTDAVIRNTKPSSSIQKKSDGGGLALVVDPDGRKYFIFRYRFEGKEKTISLGVYPQVKLLEARQQLIEVRAQLKAGLDPSAVRKTKKYQAKVNHEDSFESIAREWFELQQDRLKNDKYKKSVVSGLERNIFPEIGSKPVNLISTSEVLQALRKIEQQGTSEVAKRTLGVINNIFLYAISIGKLDNNPSNQLHRALKSVKKGEFAYILVKDLAPFVQKLDTYTGEPSTILALKLLMLTFVRPGEVRGARWEEFDLIEKIWRIPEYRMKRNVEHLVPLSTQVIEILTQLKPLTGMYDLLFPSRSNKTKPISDATMNRAIKRLGFDFVGHGFRKTASTWLHESGYEPQAIERQLAHNEKDATKAAYNKALHLDKRKVMMQDWGNLIENNFQHQG